MMKESGESGKGDIGFWKQMNIYAEMQKENREEACSLWTNTTMTYDVCERRKERSQRMCRTS